jgi:hypothetical protein
MQVLLERLQNGKVFSLWMKYELARHEEELIDKYNIRRTILVEGNPRQEKERAGKMAAVLAVLVGVGAMPFLRVPGPAIALGIITLIVGWIGIYNYIRETVRVNDILNGRHFACRSIFTLLNKEEELGLLADKFAVFLDALKDWGGRAVVEIPPGKPPIARLIGKPRAAE